MKRIYFGDSYDLVKRSLIAWLSEFGDWKTHPMFTNNFDDGAALNFSRLIGTDLLSTRILTSDINRDEYFSLCREVGNLFLDPDTGVSVRSFGGEKSVGFVFGEELMELCRTRPKALTLIFDQSYSWSLPKKTLMQEKLAYFSDQKIQGFIYDSHATFLLLGLDSELVKRARIRLIDEGLPSDRLVERR